MWNSWFDAFGNRASGLTELHDLVDNACRDVGRNPEDVERTVAVYVKLSSGGLRVYGDDESAAVAPITGTREQIAEELRAFESAGISHIQIVLDPIDASAVEELAEIVRLV